MSCIVYLIGIVIITIFLIYLAKSSEKYTSTGSLSQVVTNGPDFVYENDLNLRKRKRENFVAPYIPSFYYPYYTYPTYKMYSPYYMNYLPHRYYRPLRHPYPFITAI